MLSVKLHHLPTIQACNSAKEAWDALEEMCTAQNNARRLQLGQELGKLKPTPGESLTAYLGRTKKLQTAIIAAGHPIDNKTAILDFLMGLGPEYEMEKKILTSMNIELRWTSTLSTLYPVEEAAAEATTASEGPTVAVFSVSGLRDALPSWPKDKPMPRSERRRRVVCWNCSTRDHYAHECPTATDRPHGSGGGPSASFMITTTKKPRKPSVAGPSVDATMSPLSKPTDHKWLIDSGASNNIKPTATRLTNYDAGGSEVTVANGQTLDSPGRGFIAIATSLGGAVTLTDTTLVPGISTNLFSVRAADRAGGDIRFYQGTCTIKQNGVTVAMGYVNKDEQYELALGSVNKRKTAPVPPHANVAYGKANPRGDLWHRRFGHLGYANVGKAANIATGMSITGADIKANIGTVCEPCVKARMQVHLHGAGELPSC